MPNMDVDEILLKIGEFGFQQKLYFLYGCLIGATYVSGQMLQIVYSGAEPNFLCYKQTAEANYTVYNNSCPPSGKLNDCSSLVFTSPFTSIVSEWSLICSDAYKIHLVEAVFMAGVLIGNFGFGAISDCFGRLRTLRFALLGMVASSVSSALAPSFLLHIILRLVSGIMTGGTALTSYVWATEFIGPSCRALCGIGFQAMFPLGMALHSLLAYLFPYWRIFIVVSSIYGFIFFLFIFSVPESPRWLALNGRHGEAMEALALIAYRNGTLHCLDPRWHLSEQASRIFLKNQQEENVLTLIRHPILRKQTFIQIFSWFVNSLMYYGMTLAGGKLGLTNLYLSTTLSGFVEWPGYVASIWLLGRVGRRAPLAGFMLAAALAATTFAFIPSGWEATRTAVGLTGKLCISASFAIIFVHSAELFPTAIRNSGLGLTCVAARIGGILAPFTSLLDGKYLHLQYPILGILAFASGLLNMLLPETLNRSMIDTVAELEASVVLGLPPDEKTSLLFSSSDAFHRDCTSP